MARPISYAQRYEDMHLLRALGDQASGFYIDIGAGHPVYDNVSFAFYLRGWRGITVEPNPWLAQLSEAVRPRDFRLQSLVGANKGEASYYLVADFHGLSTTVESHAEAAKSAFGKGSTRMTMPITTMRDLCEQYAGQQIDFLKIDVEGAEQEVLAGNDWDRFRPKIVLAEALEPVTLAEAWERWDPLLIGNRYRFALFDGLNRYYVAAEHPALVERLAAPLADEEMVKFSSFKPAADDPLHPDHGLARLLAGVDMVRLPLLSFDELAERLVGDLEENRPAQESDVAAAHERLFGAAAPAGWGAGVGLSPGVTIRDFYRSATASEAFRAACGRISASSAW